jgi:hypothetical protein
MSGEISMRRLIVLVASAALILPAAPSLGAAHSTPHRILTPGGIAGLSFGARYASTFHRLRHRLGKPDHVGTWREGCDNQPVAQTRDIYWGELVVEFGRGTTTNRGSAHGSGHLLDYTVGKKAEYYDQSTGKFVGTSLRHVRTSRGIRPGSTARQVHHAYGKAATYYPGDPSYSIMKKPYYVITAKHHQSMTVDLSRRRPHGVVDEINAGNYCIAE